MKKKKSEMSGLVLLLFSTLTLICGTTTSVKAQSSDNKKEIGVLKTLGKEDDMVLKQLPIHNLVVILVLQPVCRLCLLFLRRILTILQQQSKKRYKGM